MQYCSIYCWHFKSVCKLSSSDDGKKQNPSVHTLHFWNISEWYSNKRIKTALEIGYQHYQPSPNSNIFVVEYQSFTKFLIRWPVSKYILSGDKYKTKKNFSKTFLKNDSNTKFQLYYGKVSANAKISIQCFKNWGGANAPNVPPWLRACCITAIARIIYKAIRRMSGGLQDAINLSYTTWNQHFEI